MFHNLKIERHLVVSVFECDFEITKGFRDTGDICGMRAMVHAREGGKMTNQHRTSPGKAANFIRQERLVSHLGGGENYIHYIGSILYGMCYSDFKS